jgi:hypothetical protein
MNSLFPNHFAAAPIVRENKVSIVGLTEAIFQIMTNPEVKLANGDTSTTVNEILRNNFTGYRNHENPYVSGYIYLFLVRNLYLTCSGLGNFNIVSINGDRSIIKKIIVNAGYGEMTFVQSVVGIDYLDCSHQTLSRLGFQLKDVFGNIIDLQNNYFSFSSVFLEFRKFIYFFEPILNII